ncbi:MAG TPA: hypothetical protein VN258_08470 [Mobilitalea sp.]|nr:hypothetical protein [Mobilitalea sp.]
MEKILALYDSDVFYATHFMEYFKKKKDFQFVISVFTRKESLEEFLCGNSIEILLIGEQNTLEDISTDKIHHIYKLSDRLRKDVNSEYATVMKYQAVQTLMSEIMADYYMNVEDACITNPMKQLKVITVYSPVQSTEAQAFTWAMSTLMAQQSKVLLVILDLLPIQLLASIDSTIPYLSEFIYYLKENPNIIMKMKTLLGYAGNLSYLSGIAHGSDLLSLNRVDIQKLLEELRTNTDYEAVVFYLGGYMEAGMELIRLSNNVIIAGMETAYEAALYQTLIKQLELTGIELNRDKFLRIQLQEEREIHQFPISMTQLMQSVTWNNARQSLKYIS